MTPEISIIIPILNERDNLEPLFEELVEVLKELAVPYEVIVIDDCSKDGSFEVLESIIERIPHIKAIRFKKNFGQTAALMAGIEHARGDFLIPMDGDLQNDPHDISKMLEEAKKGSDIVSGWRKNRKDHYIRTLFSKVANRLLSLFLNVQLHDYGCSLKVYRAEVIKGVQLYGEMHRFLPAVANWDGAIVTEMVVNHRPRKHGRSKYSFKRVRAVFLDLIAMKFFTSYINKPIRVFGRLSIWTSVLGTAAFAKLIWDKWFYGQDMTDSAFMLAGVFFFIVSIQLMAFGLLCEVEMRTYYESQGKKTYRIDKVRGS